MTEISFGVGLAVLLLPPLAYLCVKMATLGYLKAQRRFREQYPDHNQENVNGERTRKAERRGP